MIRLHYSDGFLTTSEAIAEAVLQYAQALAERNMSDLVTVPIVDESLGAASSSLLIGPASQLYTSPASGRPVELEDEAIVADLVARTRRARSDPTAAPVDPAMDADPAFDDWSDYRPPTG